MISRGFLGRRPAVPEGKEIPPGQYLETGFPVLSYEPTPRIATAEWSFTLEIDGREPATWSFAAMQDLPQTDIDTDIHCVTKWSKLDTHWKGVDLDVFFAEAGIEPDKPYLMAYCYGGYTTNLPTADVRGGKAFVAWEFEGEPLTPEHGGPARLLVPHLYLWKSAKWLQGIRFMDRDAPGFWEANGYHMYGDPWKEQRYRGD